MTGFDAVRAWRDIARASGPGPIEGGLSPEGAREAWNAAWDALDDESLAAVESMGGRPFPRAVIVAAETVFTAPIEWCAVLLGRGSSVVIKHARAGSGATAVLVEAARQVGLPLEATDDRAAIANADLVVAMGSDETVGAIRKELPASARFLPHGHRFSVAWLGGGAVPNDPLVPADFSDPLGSIAADAVLYDGRGCLSPVCVLTTLPLAEACDGLSDALSRASTRWPPGTLTALEGAEQRARRALARAVGRVCEGDGWSIHGLSEAHFSPIGIPRSVAVISVPNIGAAAALLAPYRRALSTVGTDSAASADTWLSLGATRVCRVGRMQRPPLLRPHDGEDWLRATALWVSTEFPPFWSAHG